jgi:acetyl esterase
MFRIRTSLTALAVIVLAAGLALAAEATSENNARLKKALERFPEADANRDGVLTQAEAQAFIRKRAAERPAPAQARGGEKPAPDFADVKYGPHERNVLDFWKAESRKPTPLVVYIHGGGFVGGDKRSVQAGVLRECLSSGISVAAIHYRFVTTDPFPAPQHDGARAIQFLRSKADEWNIDPKRIAAYGGSAGAGISLWLAMHDDLADPASDDPVARQSSRLCCAGSFGGQTSYDPHVIKEWIGGRAYEHPSIYKCYAVQTLDQLDDPKLQKLYDEVSAIKHLTKDDPPIFMFYAEPYGPLPENARPGQGIHHPMFGKKLQAAMDELGIESVYLHRDEFHGDPNAEMLKFFRKHFGME